jgi:hypothetical protein
LFSIKTKPCVDAADKSCSGASGLEAETSMIGILAFDISVSGIRGMSIIEERW